MRRRDGRKRRGQPLDDVSAAERAFLNKAGSVSLAEMGGGEWGGGGRVVKTPSLITGEGHRTSALANEQRSARKEKTDWKVASFQEKTICLRSLGWC